jgi:hypothetical protein
MLLQRCAIKASLLVDTTLILYSLDIMEYKINEIKMTRNSRITLQYIV